MRAYCCYSDGKSADYNFFFVVNQSSNLAVNKSCGNWINFFYEIIHLFCFTLSFLNTAQYKCKLHLIMQILNENKK